MIPDQIGYFNNHNKWQQLPISKLRELSNHPILRFRPPITQQTIWKNLIFISGWILLPELYSMLMGSDSSGIAVAISKNQKMTMGKSLSYNYKEFQSWWNNINVWWYQCKQESSLMKNFRLLKNLSPEETYFPGFSNRMQRKSYWFYYLSLLNQQRG